MKISAVFLVLFIPLAGMADVVVPAERVEDSVNIRLEPDTSSDVVGKLSKGTSMPLVSSIEGWHEVQLEGDATGYVSADWSSVEPDPVAEVEEAPAAVEDAVAATEVVAETAEEVTEVVEEAESVVAEVVEAAPTEPEPAPEPEPQQVPDIEPVIEAEFEEPEPVVEETPPVPVPAPAGPSIELKADRDFVVKLRKEGELGNSQLFDNGNMVGIGTNAPEQRLEVNGSIRIFDQNSSVAGLMITQSSGETGYIMHNRASTLTIGAGSIDRVTIDRDGNLGIGVARPSHPLEMASGAHVTAGGVWTNRSSRTSKENVESLSGEAALAAVMQLEPVSFNYKAEQGEDYVGFIAEDVPSLLASTDGASLSAMDVVAALTKVVQEQQRRIEELEAKLADQ